MEITKQKYDRWLMPNALEEGASVNLEYSHFGETETKEKKTIPCFFLIGTIPVEGREEGFTGDIKVSQYVDWGKIEEKYGTDDEAWKGKVFKITKVSDKLIMEPTE